MKTNLKQFALATAVAIALAGCASAPPAPIEINLVALNDFHGNLEASRFTYPGPDGQQVAVKAGGIDMLGGALAAWRREDPQLVVVGAGDLVGGTPAMSSMWADEPTLNALSMLGMDFSSVGNHEFDGGRIELLRQQHGGCGSPRPEKACKFAPDYRGASFSYLGANVVDKKTGKPFLPAYKIKEVRGVKMAFIGAVLQTTPQLVLASGIEGLAFEDEADSINRVIPELKAAGVTVFIAMIHEGGSTTERFDQPGCSQLKGPIVDIVRRLDPAIRLVASGHTHRGYLCEVEGRTVTQAASAGHLLSRIRLSVDPQTRTLQSVSARNVMVREGDFAPDPKLAAYLAEVRQRSAASLAKPVAMLAVPMVSRSLNAAGESALGDMVADSVLEATASHGVQIGLVNTAGIRKDLDTGAGLVASFGQAQIVLPFANTMVIMDMTGSQLYEMLELQWNRSGSDTEHSMLQVSEGFTYQWDSTKPRGARVVPGSVKLNGQPVEAGKMYRVAANNFLAEGGDGFPVFAQIKGKRFTEIRDIDAFASYLRRRAQAGKPAGLAQPAGRIQRIR